MGGAAPCGRLVVEALTKTKPEGAAVAVAVAITAAAAVARRPAARISTSVTTAAASPAAELGEGRMGECGWLHFSISFLDAWCGQGCCYPGRVRSPIANTICVTLCIIFILIVCRLTVTCSTDRVNHSSCRGEIIEKFPSLKGDRERGTSRHIIFNQVVPSLAQPKTSPESTHAHPAAAESDAPCVAPARQGRPFGQSWGCCGPAEAQVF